MNTKKAFGALCGALVGLYFLAFLTFYIPAYAVEVKSVALLYVLEFLGRLFKFVAPCIGGTALYLYMPSGKKPLLLGALCFSAAGCVYNLLYYYLYFLAYGNDSIEAVSIAFGAALLGWVLEFGFIILLYYLCLTVARRVALGHVVDSEVLEFIKNERFAGKIFDFSSPAVAGMFAICFLQFLVSLANELTSIVSYLFEYAGTYRTDEIVYIVVSLLFIFGELFIGHGACYLMRKIIKEKGLFNEQ